MLDLRNGVVLRTRSGRRFAVCCYKVCDDAPDTFRLRSLQLSCDGVGLRLSRVWTAADMDEWGLTIEQNLTSATGGRTVTSRRKP